MNFRSIIWLFFVTGLILAQACKTSQPAKPSEVYTERTPPEPSIVQIPIRISIKALEKMVNAQLDTILYEDDRIEEDGYIVTAKKREAITVNVDSNRISYKVPLQLFIEKNLGFTRVNARAALALQFFTDFNIKNDWSLETLTQVGDYEWLERPRVGLGGVSIPVQFVGNIILEQSKETISKSIDEQVQENFDLRKYVEEAWVQLHEPVEISPEYQTWLLVNPQRLSMTPVYNTRDTISATIIAESMPSVRLGEKPEGPKVSKLPDFEMADYLQQSAFQLFLDTEIPYTTAQELALENLQGEEFSSGKWTAVVENLKLFGQGDELVVEVELSGSYNGAIYLTGRPVFDEKRNTVDIKNLDYTLDTRSFMLRTAGWLFRSNLKRRIQENMDFYLDYNLEEIRSQMQEQLAQYEIAPGVILKGNLDNFGLQDVWLKKDGIGVVLGLNGQLDVRVQELSGE